MQSLLFILLAVTLTTCVVQASDAEDLESLTRQWLELQQAIRDTDSQWQQEQHLLQDEKRLLTLQNQKLKDDLQSATATLTDVRNRQQDASAKLEQATGRRAAISERLDRAEADFRGLLAALPESLRSEVTLAPASSLAGRLQSLGTGYEALARLGLSLRVGSLVVAGDDGKERQMDVLYIGLSQAFAVDATNQSAAVGASVEGDWQWSWGQVAPAAVRRAIAIYRGDTPADFVPLPLQRGELP